MLGLVAREGDAAPGTSTNFTEFGSAFAPVFNSRGDMAFWADLEDTPEGRSVSGIWKKLAGGPLQLVDYEANSATSSFSFGLPVLNDAGEVAYNKRVTDINAGVTTRSIRLESGGSLRVVYSSDDPGTLGQPSLNNAGETAFRASVSHDGGNYIYSESGGSLRIVARNGGTAPGTPPEAVFSDFGRPSINNAGQTAFSGSLEVGQGGVTIGNQSAIWSERGGTLQLVARGGDLAPDGTIFENFAEFSYIDNEGYTAFNATAGASIDTYWSEREGALHLDAQVGDAVPGATFSDEVFGILVGQNINSSGRVAFWTIFTPAAGIYAEGCDGVLQSVVRLDDIIDVDDGPGVDNRFVQSVFSNNFTTTQDGRESPFNDRGQLAFSAVLTGGGGVFVSDAVALPIREADFDEDGDVDEMDLLIWQGGFGMNGNALHGDGDADDDGDVDGSDFLTWQQQFGSEATCSSGLHVTYAVPEPSSASLCLAFGFFIFSRSSQKGRKRPEQA